MAYDIDLEPERTTGPRFPTIKLRDVGDQWVGMLIDYDPTAAAFVYGTSERKLSPDGKPKTKDVLTVLILPRTSCTVSLPRENSQADSEEVPAEVGMVARVHIEGHNRWSSDRPDTFRGAKEGHGRFQLGDVIRCVFSETTRQGYGGARLTQDKKLMSFEMRKPRPDETQFVDQAYAEYQKLKAVDLEQPTTSRSAVADDDDTDDGAW